MTRRLLRFATGALIAGGAAAGYAVLVERNLFTLRHKAVPVLVPGTEPLRVLHVSDAHFTPGQHAKRAWIAGLAATDPDLVVLTGDSLAAVDAVPIALRAYAPLLERPGAFVLGSNDYYGPVFKNPLGYLGPRRPSVRGARLPTSALRDALTGAGWIDLSNARTTMKIAGRLLDLVGVDDPHHERDDYAKARGDLPADPNADVRIALTHSPEPRVLNQFAAEGYDLMLAGHTHGGQVCVPGVGALTTNCGLHRRMAKGLHRWPGSRSFLHVSAGLGTHPTAPFRFACPPEASVLTLTAR